MGRRVATSVVAALVLAALGFVVAGCGSSSAAPPTTTTTTSTTTSTGQSGPNSAAFQQYQSCLKSHGVTLPPFTRQPGSGTQQRTFTGPPPTAGTSTTQRRGGGFAGRLANLTPAQQKAAQACQSLLPTGSFRGAGGANGGASAGGAAFAKYTQCLAKHGVKFGQGSQSSTAFQKAQAACKSLLPAATNGTTSTTTTTTTQ